MYDWQCSLSTSLYKYSNDDSKEKSHEKWYNDISRLNFSVTACIRIQQHLSGFRRNPEKQGYMWSFTQVLGSPYGSCHINITFQYCGCHKTACRLHKQSGRLLEPACDYAQTVTKLHWTRIEWLANLWLSQQTDLKPNSQRRTDVIHISI